jgi:predicted double-glycine peptidase
MWIRQWTSYSCGAACLQKAVYHLKGIFVSHGKAIEQVKCKPDGTDFPEVLSALEGYGVKWRRIFRIRRRLADALESGEILLIDDYKSYQDPHFSIIMREEGRYYYVYDPVPGISVKRSRRYVLRAARTMYALS